MSAEKDVVRQRVWALLEEHAVVEPGVAGHIPTFHGREQAAARLADLPRWRSAGVVKANPDDAQHPVRVAALSEGKLLYMAVPRMATPDPFYEIDPAAAPLDAANSSVADTFAPKVAPDTMRPIDVVVAGSVAVDRSGTRLGKGAGYSDLEVALLMEAGLISPQTLIVTTVHDLQVVEADLPSSPHDFKLDFIVTPTQVIPCPTRPAPNGIVWLLVTPDQVSAIPILTRWRERHARIRGA